MIDPIDVLTPDGRPTGTVKPKREVHRDGDWHRASHLWIATHDERVLLQRRAFVKESWSGLWDISVAGHVEAGEAPIDAAIREAFEELGLRFTHEELTHIGTLRYQAVLNDGAYIENEFHEVFFVRRDVDVGSLTLDPAEVAEAALVAPEALDAYAVVRHPESYSLLRGMLR